MQFDQWWLPAGEQHLPDWMRKVNKRVDGRLTYQYHKYEAALKCVPVNRRGVAVDIGGHVGLWSWFMARDFAKLAAFEPMDEHAACWRRNMDGIAHAKLHQCALGDHDGGVRLLTRTQGSSGDTGVELGGAGGQPAMLRRLDDFDLGVVDFIKIDCEGYEVFVLKGAAETIKRSKPVIIVEQKTETGGPDRYGIGATDGVMFLKALGMRSLHPPISGDWIMGW